MNGRDDGKCICGVDEVGRGPLAGPVVTAALIIPPEGLPRQIEEQIRDSKQLTEKRREELYPFLTASCLYAVAECSVEEIDELNIYHATMLAMKRAVEDLEKQVNGSTTNKIDIVLVDGNRAPKLACKTIPIVKGDGKSLSIAAASIIAKVTRDRFMKKLAIEFPGYGWETNMGYGTAEHLAALRRLGPTIWHRKSFEPVAQLSMAI